MFDGPINEGGHFLLGHGHFVVTKVVDNPTWAQRKIWVRYDDNHVFAYPNVRETWHDESEFRQRAVLMPAPERIVDVESQKPARTENAAGEETSKEESRSQLQAPDATEGQPEEEPFFSLACDIGAHEQCRTWARYIRPCQCSCHGK